MKNSGSIICSALLLLGLTVGSLAVANGAQPSMTVTFIDCDQGDSILVESNGHRMLVDGGKAVHAKRLRIVCAANPFLPWIMWWPAIRTRTISAGYPKFIIAFR